MADASDDPDDVVVYYRKILEGYDCVFGSRFIQAARSTNYPLVKLFVNRIVNKLLQWLFWTRFNDLTNAFKAYRTAVIRDCGPYRASHFNITIEMSLSALIRKLQHRADSRSAGTAAPGAAQQTAPAARWDASTCARC